MISAQLMPLGRDIYTKGPDQEDELDDDRTGVALATRAGLDPCSLVAVLQRLRTATPDHAFFSRSLSPNPPAQLRLNQLEQATGTRLDAYAGQPASSHGGATREQPGCGQPQANGPERRTEGSAGDQEKIACREEFITFG